MSTLDFNPSELNTVETSLASWQDFIEASIASDFFKQSCELSQDIEKAASLTLLHQYINIFEEEARKKVLEDAEIFYEYAKGFIEELAPYRYNSKGYDARIRTLYLGKIRSLLREERDQEGKIRNKNHYEFVRALVKFLSSLDYVIAAYDHYKEYRFRILAQTQSDEN